MKSAQESPLFKHPQSENFHDHYDLRKILSGLSRHTWLIVLLTLSFAAVGAWGTYYFKTHFKTEAILVFQDDETRELPGGIPFNKVTLATALDMIKLPANLQALKNTLELENTIPQLDKMIDVPPPRINSNLIRLIAKADQPQQAIDVANTLAKIAVQSGQEYYGNQLKSALYSYQNQLGITQQNFTKQMQEIEDFKREYQYLDMDENNRFFVSRLVEARKQMQDSNLRYNGLLVEFEHLNSQSQKFASQTQNPSNSMQQTNLRARINALENALVEARLKYAKDNPKIRVLEKELVQLNEELIPLPQEEVAMVSPNMREKLELERMHLQGKVRSAQKVKQEVAIQAAKLDQELDRLPAAQITMNKLLKNKRFLEEQIHFLSNAVDNIQLLLKSPRGTVMVYRLSEKATQVKENWWIDFLPLIGGLFGFGVGLAFAFGLELKDPRLCTTRQVEQSYFFPCFGVMPRLVSLKYNAASATLFYIRELSEQIERIYRQRSLNPDKITLTLTSAVRREGKSLIAYFLAWYYQSLGKKVLLIDAGSKHNPFLPQGGQIQPSLAGCIEQNYPVQEAIFHGQIDFVCLGFRDGHMKEKVKSARFKQGYQALKDAYDVIILDSPGVLEEEDAPNLATYSDLTLFVVNSTTTKKEVIDTALTALSQRDIRPSGMILNRVNTTYIRDPRIKTEISKNRSLWRRFVKRGRR